MRKLCHPAHGYAPINALFCFILHTSSRCGTVCSYDKKWSFLSFTTSFYPGYLSLFSLTVQFPYISQDIKLTEIKLP